MTPAKSEKRAHATLIGRRLAARRAQLEIDRAALAGQVGVSVQYIGMIEQGDRLPSIPVLCRIAHNLGSTVDALACPDATPDAA
jgi:transcriptional regulator with XRE-family HTH domain